MYIINFFIIFFVTPLIVMASIGKRIKNGYKIIGICVLISSIFLALTFGILSMFGRPLGEFISGNIDRIASTAVHSEEITSMLGFSELSPSERLSKLVEIYTLAVNSVPALLIIILTVISYLEYLLISSFKIGKDKLVSDLLPLRDLTFPKETVWGAIAIYMITFAIKSLDVYLGDVGDVLEINARILFQFLFQIQGISVLLFLIDKKNWHKSIGILIIIVFFMNAIGQMLLSFIGFFEMGFGLRKVIDKKIDRK